MTELGEWKNRADAINQALKLIKPETDKCFDAMRKIEPVLAETRIYTIVHLRATSHYSSYEDLRDIISTAVSVIFSVVESIGEMGKDFEPISLGSELLDDLDIHIQLRMSLEVLRKQAVPIGAELNDINSSRTRIITALDAFNRSASDLFSQLRNRYQRN